MTFFSSRFIAAIFLFITVDLVIKLEFHPDPFNIPDRSFIWWTVKDYRQFKHAPDILLFGSSLMHNAVNTADATHYREIVDLNNHHYSSYLAELLRNRYGYPISNFCFSIHGQMPSDVYAISANFINEKYKPRLIVWGIAPRDLHNNLFPGPKSSDTGRYMDKIAGKEIFFEEGSSLKSVIDQFLRKSVYMYSAQDDFLSLLKQTIRTLQNQRSGWTGSLATIFWGNSIPCSVRRGMLREFSPFFGTLGDIDLGEWLIYPTARPSKTLDDNSGEYCAAYNPFQPKTFIEQSRYLEKFLQQQNDLGVKVLLVNMPLTRVNMLLLPKGSYNNYLYTLRTLAKKYNAEIMDLNNDSRFTQSDFRDTAHLNGFGGQKFMEVLSMDKRLAVLGKETLSADDHSSYKGKTYTKL